MENKATIYTYSIIYSASEDFKDKTPFAVAIIENGEERLLTRIDNYTADMKIDIGMEVEFSRMDENEKPLYNLI